jgi:hypothetical protein
VATDDKSTATRVRVPVRTGSYQYVLVRPDGSSTTIPVGPEALEEGSVEVEVSAGDAVMEVALSSTSDPDLDPPRGELWPAGGGR